MGNAALSFQAQSRLATDVAWLLALVACQMLAFWHSWLWLSRRLTDSSTELFTFVLVLGLLIALCVKNILLERQVGRVSLSVLSLAMMAYAISHWLSLPSIIQAFVAVVTLAYTLHCAAFIQIPSAAFLGMVFCALPVVPSLQFYLGYPARLISASLTVALLSLNGLHVRREGTYLVWQDRLVQFDAPCSGVTMLWAALLLTFTFAYVRMFTYWELLKAIGLCAVLILLSNVIRAAALFYLEGDLLPFSSSWWHEGVGLTVFFLTIVALYLSLEKIRK